MGWVRWILVILFWAGVAAFLHYTLPQRDIVRITDTYESRIEPGENPWFWTQTSAGPDGTVPPRDVFFLQTVRTNGSALVFRNEDTGWGWPPFFKFDTATLQAEAADLRSTGADPVWVAVRHYGWRIELFTIYPNVLSVRPVDGPDVRLIPWGNIAILIGLAALFWAIWVRWTRFREARIDPTLEEVGDRFDDGATWMRRLFRRR